jgi:hypothetical protein
MIITKKYEGIVSEMKELLIMQIEIQKRLPLSLITIEAKARNLFKDICKISCSSRGLF